MSDDGFRNVFRSQATQYYAAGRAAARFGLCTIYGNLLHHAVEMYLKASLVGAVSVHDLRNHYGHKLAKLWARFKQARTSYDAHDSIIAALERWEAIRYPDQLVAHHSTLHAPFRHSQSFAAGKGQHINQRHGHV